ncbi:MAG: LacI family DNA-binding transcriptional regulator [Acidobacteriaceae bacterium]
MPKKRSGNATITDVARASGVGVMTASRVVNGGKYVSAETVARVRAAIVKLAYEPNEAARVLKGKSPRVIGLIVPNLADTFFSACAHGVQLMAATYGFRTLLFACEGNVDSEAEEIGMMKSRGVAGLLIVPSRVDSVDRLKELRARGIPIIVLDRTLPGLDVGEVTVENFEGARKAVNHLIEHGHKQVLCVGYDSQFNSIGQRVAGYERAMADAGLKAEVLVVDEKTSVAPRVLQRLRSRAPVTALFTLNNVTTIQVLQTLQRENIQVPQGVAIIGFDDFELASLLAAPLTAVSQPAVELGRSGTQLLIDLIRSDASEASKGSPRMLLPTELIIRRSCGCEPSPQRQG